MIARFTSTCPRCRQPIGAGEEIEKFDERRYAHKGCPPAATREESPVLEPGVYEKNGQVYVVKPNREKTHLYAKRLVEIPGERLLDETGAHVQFDFEYAKGAIYDLRPGDKMPVDRAKELVLRYGRCINCGAYLKDATSVERGIGPVCIKYFRTEEASHEAAPLL